MSEFTAPPWIGIGSAIITIAFRVMYFMPKEVNRDGQADTPDNPYHGTVNLFVKRADPLRRSEDFMARSPQRDMFTSMIGGGVLSFTILGGMQLGVFDPLGIGPLTTERLAEFLEVGPDKLRRLLNALVASGLLEVEGGVSSNTPEA